MSSDSRLIYASPKFKIHALLFKASAGARLGTQRTLNISGDHVIVHGMTRFIIHSDLYSNKIWHIFSLLGAMVTNYLWLLLEGQL